MMSIKQRIEMLEKLARIYESRDGKAYLLTAPEWPEWPKVPPSERPYSRELRNKYNDARDELEYLQGRLSIIAALAEAVLEMLKDKSFGYWLESLQKEAEDIRAHYLRLLHSPNAMTEKDRQEFFQSERAYLRRADSWPNVLKEKFLKTVKLIRGLYRERLRCLPSKYLTKWEWNRDNLEFDQARRFNHLRSAPWEDLKFSRGNDGGKKDE